MNITFFYTNECGKCAELKPIINEFNKHLDRHEQIGKGFIKIKNLIKFVKPYKSIPLILETSSPYGKQIKLINNNL